VDTRDVGVLTRRARAEVGWAGDLPCPAGHGACLVDDEWHDRQPVTM